MERPFLSIITINYNNLQGLERTFASVTRQSYADYEYILVDGDSTDGSKAFLEQNRDRFSGYVSEPDSGIYEAMNKGIKLAKGQYILFLNSGDALNGRDVLRRFIEHPEFGGDIVYGNYKFDNGYKRYESNLTPYYFMRTSLPHQSTLFRSSVFEKMGNYDQRYRIGADRAFYIKCYMSGQFIFKHLDVALTHFDLKGLSNDPEFKKAKLAEDEQIFKDCFGEAYDDLVKQRAEEQKRAEKRRWSLKGILKRLGKRLNLG